MSGMWCLFNNGFYFHCYDYCRKKEEEEEKNHFDDDDDRHHCYCYTFYSVCLGDQIKEIDEVAKEESFYYQSINCLCICPLISLIQPKDNIMKLFFIESEMARMIFKYQIAIRFPL